MPRLKNQLPKKLSDCLEIALIDMAKCKRSKTFNLDMGKWFTPQIDGTCSVCLAGGVLAKTLAFNPKASWLGVRNPIGRFLKLKKITKHDSDRLTALDFLRTGNIRRALRYIGDRKRASKVLDVQFSLGDYFGETEGNHDDYLNFRRNLRIVVEELQRAGA